MNSFSQFNCHCNYCSDGGNYIWKKDKDLFIEIPKNGSSSLKNSILGEYQRTKVIPEDFEKSIAIVRNPVNRFKSLCAMYFSEETKRKLKGLVWLKEHHLGEFNPSTIASVVLKNFDKVNNGLLEPHHWDQQISFIPQEIFSKPVLLVRLQDLSFVFPSVPHVNKTDKSQIVITEDDLSLIKEKYANDFKLYNEAYIP